VDRYIRDQYRLERFVINHPILVAALFIGALGLAIGAIEGAAYV